MIPMIFQIYPYFTDFVLSAYDIPITITLILYERSYSTLARKIRPCGNQT